MVRVGIVGAAGRMGELTLEVINASDTLQLGSLCGTSEGEIQGYKIKTDLSALKRDQVAIDFTHPDSVMDNLRTYRRLGVEVVMGTSGFTKERINEATRIWRGSPHTLLIIPNFSVGAVLQVRFAELATTFFQTAEIVETHHSDKPDSPSGTALDAAKRISKKIRREPESNTVPIGRGTARGEKVDRIQVHSIRLPGFLARQEIIFAKTGERMILSHETTSRTSFALGIGMALADIMKLPSGVIVGLDTLLFN